MLPVSDVTHATTALLITIVLISEHSFTYLQYLQTFPRKKFFRHKSQEPITILFWNLHTVEQRMQGYLLRCSATLLHLCTQLNATDNSASILRRSLQVRSGHPKGLQISENYFLRITEADYFTGRIPFLLPNQPTWSKHLTKFLYSIL